MRKSLILRLTIIIALLLLTGVGTMAILATAGPMATGSGLFAIQSLAEQSWLGLQSRPAARASYALDLLERRMRDLAQSAGQTTQSDSLIEVDRVFNQAVVELANLDVSERQTASARLLDQVQRLLQMTESLRVTPQQNPQMIANFNAKLITLRASLLAGPPSAGELVALSLWRLDAARPGGSSLADGFQHPFALLGKHAEITCQKCHNTTAAPDANVCTSCHANQPRPASHAAYLADCVACHTPVDWKGAHFNHAPALIAQCATCHENRRPANHLTGDCVACHTTPGVTWKGAKFGHVGVTQCTSCHESRRPANHFAGECAACHTTPGVTWKGAKFGHAGVTQCVTCHESRRPANHYKGDCAGCHTQPGVTWKGAKFAHAGVTQCATCHEARRPANHYKGDCAGCHTQPGVTWGGAKFNHSGIAQCASCHESRRPANHYQGECSACHANPGVTWKGAKFNHAIAGAINCVGCHAARRPGNHFQAQCSTCHTTSGWKPASFKHTFPMNHNGAKSQCATCHPAMTSAYTCFNCHNQASLTKKHAEEKITFPANCMSCHADGKEK